MDFLDMVLQVLIETITFFTEPTLKKPDLFMNCFDVAIHMRVRMKFFFTVQTLKRP